MVFSKIEIFTKKITTFSGFNEGSFFSNLEFYRDKILTKINIFLYPLLAVKRKCFNSSTIHLKAAFISL